MKKYNHCSLLHRFTALALTWILITLFTLPVLADRWYYPEFGRCNDSNYCPKDGIKMPSGLKAEGGTHEVHVGDSIYFGTYEQDNNKFNGAEPIEWRVLAKEGNRILVISEYALEASPYNTGWTNVTWESCTLRSWLNGEFYDKAFTPIEQSAIGTTTVKTQTIPEFDISSNDTQDKVFLLSIWEADQYFSSDEARRCIPTEYAIAQGAWTSDYYQVGGRDTCWWWLRSLGTDQYSDASVSSVDIGGGIFENGIIAFDDHNCVRPALWINLES